MLRGGIQDLSVPYFLFPLLRSPGLLPEFRLGTVRCRSCIPGCSRLSVTYRYFAS